MSTTGEQQPAREILFRRHLRVGWWALLVFLSMGIALETLHGFKIGFYLDASNHTRLLLWTLAHAHGAFCYADGVQAVGMFPMDVRQAGVDFMTAGTYKWLLASFGVAPFFIRRELLNRIPLDRHGALHVEREHPIAGTRFSRPPSASTTRRPPSDRSTS